MTIIIYLPLLICLAGLLIYLLQNHSKWNEISLFMFKSGLTVFLLAQSGAMAHGGFMTSWLR